MNCVPFNGHHLVSWKMYTVLIVSTTLAFGRNLGIGFAAASSIKYGHGHGPLPSALTGRSLHDSSSSSNSVGKTLIGNRGTGDSMETAGTTVSNSAVEEGGGGGEVLVPKTFPLSAQEPTCEQLRAMWIFSKRQSRAAEITNEIPTYRDPFAYNVWEPYYSTTRSMGAMRVGPRFGERSRSPVFGRVISREPALAQRLNIGERQRHMPVPPSPNTDISHSRLYGSELKTSAPLPNGRRTSQYRHVGTNGPSGSSSTNGSGQLNSVAVQGSFQKLKEIIWTERAKELTQQRRAEEIAARAAVLKEIAKGQNLQALYKANPKSESYLMDENRSPDRDTFDHMNDDHQTESIARGQSKVEDQKKQNINSKNEGKTRSFIGKQQKPSIYSSTSGGRSGRHMLPSMISSGFSFDDSGISKSYPLRPSHFRERNRSLYKQHSPSEFFQRDARRKETYDNQQDTISDTLIFKRLVDELNRRILEKQQVNESYGLRDEVPQVEDNRNWLNSRTSFSYDDELPGTLDQYVETQEFPDYYQEQLKEI